MHNGGYLKKKFIMFLNLLIAPVMTIITVRRLIMTLSMISACVSVAESVER